MRTSYKSMASKIIIGSFVRPWVLTIPGIREWPRGKIRLYRPHPLERGIVVAYGSFGIDLRVPSIGVEALVTTDQRLATHFHTRHAEIAHRFHDMIAQLPAPYAALTLPTVVTTASLLAQA